MVLEGDELLILTDGGKIAIALNEITDVSLERLVELPVLSWIRIAFERDQGASSVLVVSRQATSLRRARCATRRLYERIVDWYADGQLRWHDAAEREHRHGL